MSNEEFSRKIKAGIELAGKRMIADKALHGEDVIICDSDNVIKRIPAKQFVTTTNN